MNEMQGNINTVQGEFTTLHEDVALLRDQVDNGHSILSNGRAETGSKGDRRSGGGRSEVSFSGRRSEKDHSDGAGWQGHARRHFNNHGRRGRPVGRHNGPNRVHGNYERYDRDGYDGGREEVCYDNPSRNFKHTIPEFLRKFEPDTYLEWETQVEKIFSLHNYSEEDKFKLAIVEFRSHDNT